MSETSRPWNGVVTGDAGPYSDANWQQLYRAIIGFGAARANSGVFLMSGTEPADGLKVQAQAGPTTSVDVLLGAALVQGIAYLNTATVALTVAANGAGNPRIDTVILRADYALQTIRLALKQGTAAASPTAPALTQSAGVMWEIPIADIAVANGFTSIAQSAISQRQEWVNAPPGVYLDHVLNNSGAVLNDGDVVVWDSAADRAVTTTTTLGDDRVAGVVRGQIPAAGFGRIQISGIGYVNASAAVTRGDALQVSATVKTVVSTLNMAMLLGRALETTAGSGLVLSNIRLENVTEAYILIQDQKAQNTAGGTFTSGAFQKRDLNTEVVDTHNLAVITASVIALQPGTYRCQWSAPANGGVTDKHQTRLRNTSDTIDYIGTSEQTAVNAQTRSVGSARFRITSTKNFELQHQIQATRATDGFGLAANFTTEVYGIIEFWREGP